MTPKGQTIKGKINKLSFHQKENFFSAKDHKKNKKTDWKKISSNYICDKGLLYRMYKELLKPNSKKNKPCN